MAAQQPRVFAQLRYRVDAPNGCPDQTTFEEMVASRLGYAPFSQYPSEMVEVTIAGRLGNAVRGSMRFIDASGQELGRRDIAQPSSCGEIAELLSMSVAILLESPPERARTAVEAPPPPVPDPSPPVETAPVLPPSDPSSSSSTIVSIPEPTREQSPETDPLIGILGLSAIGELGIAANVMIGGRVAGGFRIGLLEVVLDVSASTQVGRAQLESGDVLEAAAYLANLAICAHIAPVSLCAIGGSGALQTTVQTVDQPRSRLSAIGFSGARVAVSIGVADILYLRPFLDVLGVFARTRVTVEDRPVWESPSIAGRLGFEVLAEFR